MLRKPKTSTATTHEPTFTVLDEGRLYDLPPGDGEGLTLAVVILGGGVDPDDPSFDTYCDALGIPRPTIEVLTVHGATNTPCPYTILSTAMVAMGSGTKGAPKVQAHHPPAVQEDTAVAARGGPPKLLAKILPPFVKTPPWQLLHDRTVPDHIHEHVTKIHGVGETVKALVTGAAKPTMSPAEALKALPWTFEGMMDLQLAIGLAPKARFLLVVTDDSDEGVAAAIDAAVDAGADVISNSYSYGEQAGYWSKAEAAIEAAVAKGVTITASSGNKGSTPYGPALAVSFPASHPKVLACGGTALRNHGADEVVWHDDHGAQRSASGGGYSTLYARPDYQQDAVSESQRGVPDVAANASQESGCWIWFQDPSSDPANPTGLNAMSFGTSSSAPVWGAMTLRFVQALGKRLGHLQPLLYTPSVQAAGFRNIHEGDNAVKKSAHDAYEATKVGWDPCTGLGRPQGKALLAAIEAELGA